jgi:protein disulfide-isomerase A6
MKSIVDGRVHGGESKKTEGGQKSEGSSDDKDVVVLKDGTFESTVKNSGELWIIEFYAPWCGHCKALQPHWNTAASRLKGRVKFGKVDATVETQLAKTYGVQSFPTIKVFPAGADLNKPIDYEGGRTTDTIEAAALEYLKKYPKKKDILQLLNQAMWEKECVEKGGICIIMFLPHILDTKAEGRKQFISTLEEAAAKTVTYPLYFFWTQAYDHKQFEKTLNLGSGYPAVVAISHSKKKFAAMRMAFTLKGVVEFLQDLMRGYERLYEFKELPKLNTIDKWDGKDAVALEF